MAIGKGKGPRDPSQLAAWTVAVCTGQIPAPEPPQPKIATPPRQHLRVYGGHRSQGRSDRREAPPQDYD
jgi:hypothetical protein